MTHKSWLMFQNGCENVMKEIFFRYSESLFRKAYSLVRDEAVAKDMVQEVMIELWVKKEDINLKTSLSAYLHKAIANRTLNYIRDNKLHVFDELVKEERPVREQIHSELFAEEMRMSVDEVIEGLPERCRIIFLLSRWDGLSYKEIANELGISIKTVENQVSKALKRIRNTISLRHEVEMI